MKQHLLNYLKQNNYPKDWFALNDDFKADQAGYVGKEPVYKFFETLSDNLEINAKTIAISVQPVQSFIPFHIHNYVEIIIPLQGECILETKGGTVTVSQDDIVLIGKQTPHRIQEISKDVVVVNIALKSSAFSFNDLNFMLHSSSGQSISNMLFTVLNEDYGEGQYSHFKINHDEKIVNLVYDILDEYYRDDVQSTQIIHFAILNLFSHLIRQAYHSEDAITVKSHQDISLMALLLYIEKHYQTITLNEMAEHFGFNPNYLSSYLKKQTGMTFIKLVHLQRINIAAEYLRYTLVPIDKISVKVGYENPSYFYKIFRKTLGLSPTEYRKENR